LPSILFCLLASVYLSAGVGLNYLLIFDRYYFILLGSSCGLICCKMKSAISMDPFSLNLSILLILTTLNLPLSSEVCYFNLSKLTLYSGSSLVCLMISFNLSGYKTARTAGIDLNISKLLCPSFTLPPFI